jgi:hypothetical protein
MKALLVTGCGCSKLIDIDDQHATIITVQINYFTLHKWDEPLNDIPRYTTRRFRYIGQQSAHPLLHDYAMFSEIE